MIAILERGCPLRYKADIVRLIESEGFRVHVSETEDGSLIGVVGNDPSRLEDRLAEMPGVREIRSVAPPYPLVSRAHQPEATRIRLSPSVTVGGRELVVMAGPCAVESEEQILGIAHFVAGQGAHVLRGGAFKPRSSPYSFQGLEKKGLELLAKAREETGLAIVTEVLSPSEVELVASFADVLQIGARNMQNFRLLSAVGKQPRPVLLKRGLTATLDELLMAAEYVVAAGNPRVMLCERGIRTFETATRNTFDVSAVPVLAARTHLPIIVDPSHAAGYREYVVSLTRAGIAAGADGLIVEVHPEPDKAMSDGRQSLTYDQFEDLMTATIKVAGAVDRCVAPPVKRTTRGGSQGLVG